MLKHFKFYCQKVLPLVYDQSLSYYEVLCKVVDKLNEVIDNESNVNADLLALQKEIEVIQKWIDDFDTEYIEKAIGEIIATMVLFGLTQDGHFIAYIPESWGNIVFKTSGYDYETALMPEFGHLILLY